MNKQCTKCLKTKDLNDFHNDKNSPDGKVNYCKTCNKNRFKKYGKKNKKIISQKKKAYYQDPKVQERQWKTHIKRTYGITYKKYNQMLKDQNYCCAICGKDQDEFKRKFSVDHNHSTREVRGLLCDHCNKAIGHAFDDISILQNAISYLKQIL